MIGKNQPLATNERAEAEDFKDITIHFRET